MINRDVLHYYITYINKADEFECKVDHKQTFRARNKHHFNKSVCFIEDNSTLFLSHSVLTPDIVSRWENQYF